MEPSAKWYQVYYQSTDSLIPVQAIAPRQALLAASIQTYGYRRTQFSTIQETSTHFTLGYLAIAKEI